MSKELAADYFARHESSNECHITSDGRVFHTKGSADSFANGLKDNTVASFTRDGKKEEEEVPTDEVPQDEAPQDEAPQDEAPQDDSSKDEAAQDEDKIAVIEALKTFDAETATYAEIKELAKAFSLESVSQKKEDLLAAIEAYKLIMNTEIQD